MAVASVRDLRNHFPKVKKMVEAEGEVIVTDKGEPKYRLTLFQRRQKSKPLQAKDYMARLRRHQPRPMSMRATKALDEENRGDR